MSGFTGIHLFNDQLSQKLQSFSFPEELHHYYPKRHKVEFANFRMYCYNNGKFCHDSVVVQCQDVLFGFDGINLANSPLNQVDTGKNFMKTVASVRGSFSSVYKNDNLEETMLVADHTGSRQIFYFWNSSFFAFSSSIFLLSDILRHFGVQPTLSHPASYMMLSLGYLLEDHTLLSEIRKVKAGHYITANKRGVTSTKYHDYHKGTIHTKLTRDLLDEVNNRFKRSIQLEYEKDKTYGFSHLATLSGGLDSRMNVMLAHKYGYNGGTCVTFSEGFKSDELTPRKITRDLAWRHIVMLLNKGLHLYDIETPLILNNCAVHYFGAAHTLAAVRALNFANYGLFHNGILAESIKGTYLSAAEHRPPSIDRHFRISEKLFDRLDASLLNTILNNYPTHEMFVTYNRGFNAAHNGSWMTMPFTDSVYTYMDLDVADLAYSIDPKLRYDSFFTIEWIKNLHPEAANYVWQRGIKPTNSATKIFFAKISHRLRLLLTRKWDNPFPLNEWYNANSNLRQFIQTQFEQSKVRDIIPKEIYKDMERVFVNGSVAEKLLCISYLKSIELLFIRH